MRVPSCSLCHSRAHADASRSTLPGSVLVFAVNTTSRFKYLFTGELNIAELTAFQQDFLRGMLPHTLRSSKFSGAGIKSSSLEGTDVGSDQKNNAVLDVVGVDFERVVLHQGTDALLMLYAPWCVECGRYTKVVQQLTKLFAKITTLQIVQMDAEANDAVVGGRMLRHSLFQVLSSFRRTTRKTLCGSAVQILRWQV